MHKPFHIDCSKKYIGDNFLITTISHTRKPRLLRLNDLTGDPAHNAPQEGVEQFEPRESDSLIHHTESSVTGSSREL